MKVIKPNALPTTLAGFARASTATYVDEAGVLQTAGVNVPRWQGGRLLVEAAGTNLLLRSSEFDNGAWNKTRASIAVNQATAPDGTNSADKLIEDTATGDHAMRGQVVPVVAGQTYTHSVFMKAGERTKAQFYLVGETANFVVDLITGGITITAGSPAVQIQAAGNGWWRLSYQQVAGSSSMTALYMGMWTTAISYTGDGTSGLYLWHGQLEPGDKASSVIPTTAAAVTRAADVVTGTGLLYSSATDVTAAYVAGATYAAGVQVAFDRSRYQSLQAANVGHTPDVSPTWWARLGPLNQWAMFDDQVSTQTSGTAPLRVSFEAGAFDSLAVLAVDAALVTLVVTDGLSGPEVYRRRVGMGADVVTNWYEYFFADLDFRRTQVLFTGVPLLGSAVVHLEVQGSGTVRVGHVAWGRMKPVGDLRYGVKAGIRDFSRKETDDFGLTTFVRRANSKTLTAQLEVKKAELNRTQNLLTALRATPVVWVGSDDPSYSDLMVVFGFYRDFYGSVDYPMKAIYSLEIEGLT